MFYTFQQNNSGGYYQTKASVGVGAFIIVQADSAAGAMDKFNQIKDKAGRAWFNDYCPCCGSRWGSVYDDASDTPYFAGSNDKRVRAFVHYADGSIVDVTDGIGSQWD